MGDNMHWMSEEYVKKIEEYGWARKETLGIKTVAINQSVPLMLNILSLGQG